MSSHGRFLREFWDSLIDNRLRHFFHNCFNSGPKFTSFEGAVIADGPINMRQVQKLTFVLKQWDIPLRSLGLFVVFASTAKSFTESVFMDKDEFWRPCAEIIFPFDPLGPPRGLSR